MRFKLIKIGILVLAMILVFPKIGNAQVSDYLSINIELNTTTNQFDVKSITQKAIDFNGASLPTKGDYEVDLQDQNGAVLSSGYFNKPDFKNFEVLGENRQQPDSAPPSYYQTTVYLPLNQTVDVQKSALVIKNGQNVIYKKNLSDIQVQIISVAKNKLTLKPTQPIKASQPPEETVPFKNNFSLQPIYYILIAVLLALIIIVFVLARKRKAESSNNFPPSQISN